MIPMSILPVNTGDLQVESLVHGPTAKKGRGAGSRHPAWGRPSTTCEMGRHRHVTGLWCGHQHGWHFGPCLTLQPQGPTPEVPVLPASTWGPAHRHPPGPGKDANQESLPPSPSGRSSHLHSPSKCNLRHQIKATTWVLQLNNGNPERNCIKEKNKN